MSYDTTVHDALDPPLPRVRQTPEKKKRGDDSRRRLPRAWRSVLITTITFGLVALVTWVVAAVTRSPSQDQHNPPDATTIEAQTQAAISVRTD
jgi:hypothetical protein